MRRGIGFIIRILRIYNNCIYNTWTYNKKIKFKKMLIFSTLTDKNLSFKMGKKERWKGFVVRFINKEFNILGKKKKKLTFRTFMKKISWPK